jgi:hypothetical protein
MLAHSAAVTGRLNDAVARELNIVPVLDAPANANCCTATAVAITAIYQTAVSDLANAPTIVDGYPIQNGDVVALVAQATANDNKLYAATVASNGTVSLSALSTQPPDGSLLRVVRGTIFVDTLWYFSVGTISPATGDSSGVIVGPNGTVSTYAPDPAGGSAKLVGNEGIDIQSIPSDSAWHDVWAFDFQARDYTTTGSLTVLALLKAIDGARSIRVRIECELFCGAPPTLDTVTQPDILDQMGGSGGYVDVQYAVSGNALVLQVKNLQGSAVQFAGIIGLVLIAP